MGIRAITPAEIIARMRLYLPPQGSPSVSDALPAGCWGDPGWTARHGRRRSAQDQKLKPAGSGLRATCLLGVVHGETEPFLMVSMAVSSSEQDQSECQIECQYRGPACYDCLCPIRAQASAGPSGRMSHVLLKACRAVPTMELVVTACRAARAPTRRPRIPASRRARRPPSRSPPVSPTTAPDLMEGRVCVRCWQILRIGVMRVLP
jgi:hypothetical protein